MSGVFDDINVPVNFRATCIFLYFMVSFHLNTVNDCTGRNINVFCIFWISILKSDYRYRSQLSIEYVPSDLSLAWVFDSSSSTVLRIEMQAINNPVMTLYFIMKTLTSIAFFCFVEMFIFIRKNKTHCFQTNNYPLKWNSYFCLFTFMITANQQRVHKLKYPYHFYIEILWRNILLQFSF